MVGKRASHLIKQSLAAMLVVASFTLPAPAWNETGHRIIAAIAYDNLTARARARVDELIRRHPDYGTIFVKGAPSDTPGRARWAFITAAYWPDAIRNDTRFYDDTRADAQPTQTLPGFPDMGRHTNWHYIDFNFSEDGTQFPALETPNALGELHRLIAMVGGPASIETAYALPWLLHLAGDIHNPMHNVSRYSRDLPKGDRGGNDVFVVPGPQLHAFWDGLGGNDPSPAYVNRTTASLLSEDKAKKHTLPLQTDPERWAAEGFNIARNFSYNFGLANGSREQPIALSTDYQNEAKLLGKQRLTAAGLRLAAVLNIELQ
jgi:hypothetical protein